MNIILFSEFFGKKVILPDYYMIEFFAMYMQLINTGLIQLQLFSNVLMSFIEKMDHSQVMSKTFWYRKISFYSENYLEHIWTSIKEVFEKKTNS